MQIVFLLLKPNIIASVEVRALAASLYPNIVVDAVLVLWLEIVLITSGVNKRSN